MDIPKLKQQIKKFGRKKMSEAIKIPYFTLSLKLNGNLKLTESEYNLIKSKLKESKNG